MYYVKVMSQLQCLIDMYLTYIVCDKFLATDTLKIIVMNWQQSHSVGSFFYFSWHLSLKIFQTFPKKDLFNMHQHYPNKSGSTRFWFYSIYVVFIVEKQQIPFSWSSVWLDGGSKLSFNILKVITLTITSSGQ